VTATVITAFSSCSPCREPQRGTDSARWLPKVDPANREVMLSVGACLENLITAAHAHGFVADCEVVGTRPTTDVARVVLKSKAPRDAPLAGLRERRTVRSGQSDRDISTADGQALRAAGGDDDFHFFTAGSQHGRRLAEATLEANRFQTSRDDAQSELADWMRWTPDDGRAHRNGFTPESIFTEEAGDLRSFSDEMPRDLLAAEADSRPDPGTSLRHPRGT
jgi:hypothetical protein